MEDLSNKHLGKDEVTSVIETCNFVPSVHTLLITVNMYKPENELEIVSNDEVMLDEWQYVVSAGEYCKYQPGDKIYLNLPKMIKRTIDPKDRMNMIETFDITPFKLGDNELTLIPEAYVFGKEEETAKIKA